MNEKFIRIDMNAASNHTQTDWGRLRGLNDADIEAALSTDPDAYALSDVEMLGRDGASYRYKLIKHANSNWHWALVDAEGKILASSNGAFPSRSSALEALNDVREAFLGGVSKAA